MVLTASFVLPTDRAFLPLSSAEVNSGNLTPASGHQDHTTSPSALAPFVIRHENIHHIPPNVRDDGQTPLFRTRRAKL